MPDTKGQSLAASLWNGLVAKPQRFQITKEATQNPALDRKLSPGTQVGWANSVPQLDAKEFSDYDMSPMNGRHWSSYIERWSTSTPPSIPMVTASNVMMAVSQQNDEGSIGPPDIWKKHYELVTNMRARYDPNNNWNGAASYKAKFS